MRRTLLELVGLAALLAFYGCGGGSHPHAPTGGHSGIGATGGVGTAGRPPGDGGHDDSNTGGGPSAGGASGDAGAGPPGGAPGCDDELIVNGSFESGFAGFGTEYQRVTAPAQMTRETECTIATDPSVVRANVIDWAAFGDHTTGHGEMLICDGATVPARRVWRQTIRIAPHASYRFSFWFTNVQPGQLLPALEAYAGDTLLAAAVEAVPKPGVWTEYRAVWRAGNDTSVALAIVDTTTSSDFNDFSLDDISFVRDCER